MWNKIGEFLGYPETVCDLLVELGKWLFVATLFGSVMGIILLPYLLMFGFIEPKGSGEFDSGLVFASFVISFMCKYGMHCFLDEVTLWYPRLISKLPECPRIKW